MCHWGIKYYNIEFFQIVRVQFMFYGTWNAWRISGEITNNLAISPNGDEKKENQMTTDL